MQKLPRNTTVPLHFKRAIEETARYHMKKPGQCSRRVFALVERNWDYVSNWAPCSWGLHQINVEPPWPDTLNSFLAGGSILSLKNCCRPWWLLVFQAVSMNLSNFLSMILFAAAVRTLPFDFDDQGRRVRIAVAAVRALPERCPEEGLPRCIPGKEQRKSGQSLFLAPKTGFGHHWQGPRRRHVGPSRWALITGSRQQTPVCLLVMILAFCRPARHGLIVLVSGAELVYHQRRCLRKCQVDEI